MKVNAQMKLLRTIAAAGLFVGAIAIAGCADQDKPPEPAPGTAPAAKLLTDLSSVSSTPIDPLGTHAVPKRGEGLLRDEGGDSSSPRVFGAEPGLSFPIGNDLNPTDAQLLNAKAAKFANFSEVLLDRLYAHLRIEEKSEEISRTKLPTDLKPVVITAIMDKNGKLTELILEQHSGKARIDQMMITVCKRAIWYRNPPREALSGDGNYRFTVQCRLENFGSSDETHWTFTTHLGLGIG